MRLNKYKSMSTQLKSNLLKSDDKIEVVSENEEEEEKKKTDEVSTVIKFMEGDDSGSERDSDREHYDPDNKELDEGIYGTGMDLEIRAMNTFNFKNREGEKFKIRAEFEEKGGHGKATFHLIRDFEEKTNVLGEAELVPHSLPQAVYEQEVTLSELHM